ncbi:MAG: hypothetical protein BJ554DRAFT_5766, partial [Olpidium bornovanus]
MTRGVSAQTFTALSAESGGLALGELVGAASFILNVVVGAMAVISPFEVTAYPFFRDLLFFVGAVSFVVCTVRDQRITLIEGIFLIGYYLLYVTVVVAGDWLRRRRSKRRALLVEADAEPTVLSAHDDEHNQYGDGQDDDYVERQPLLGKTPALPHPRLLRLPSTADEVEHRKRKSFLGAFEFRDAVQSWKQCSPRWPAFPAFDDDFSPVLPRTPSRHRRERSSASCDPTRGRVVERPVLFRCSTYAGCGSPGQLASASGSRTISVGGSPLQKSPLRNETERRLREAGWREAGAADPESRSRTTPERAPAFVSSIVVTPPVGGDSSSRPTDAPSLPPEPRSAGSPAGGCTPAEAPGREGMPATLSPRPVFLQTQNVPEGNIVTKDHYPGVRVTSVEEQIAGRPSAGMPAAAAVRNTLFPHLGGWRYRSLPSKFAGLIATPLVFLLIITVPVIDEDDDRKTPTQIGADLERERGPSGRTAGNHGTDVTVIDDGDVPRELYVFKWNRWLTVVQFATAPLFVSSALLGMHSPRKKIALPGGRSADIPFHQLNIYCRINTSQPPTLRFRLPLCRSGYSPGLPAAHYATRRLPRARFRRGADICASSALLSPSSGFISWQTRSSACCRPCDGPLTPRQSFGLILGVSDAIVGLTVFAM